jgi:hypothetical protein
MVERQIEKIAGTYFEALDAEEFGVRMQAARELLDRAYGKPKQAVDVDHTSGGQSLAELFAATPLGQSHSELPVDEPEGWEGTDG